MDEKDIPEVAKSFIRAQFDTETENKLKDWESHIIWGKDVPPISLNMLDARYRKLFRELGFALTKACWEYNVEPEITINIKYKKREDNATRRSD